MQKCSKTRHFWKLAQKLSEPPKLPNAPQGKLLYNHTIPLVEHSFHRRSKRRNDIDPSPRTSRNRCPASFVRQHTGLTDQQVLTLREKHGENKLREKKKKTNLQRFFDQFKDVMILILIAAAIVSFVIACVEGNPKEFLSLR